MTRLVGLAEGSQYAAAGAILRCHGGKACARQRIQRFAVLGT